MKDRIIEGKIKEFLQEKFVFRSFEIEEWLNKRRIIRYQHKEHFILKNLDFDLDLYNQEIRDWRIFNSSVVDYFFDEYCWFLMGKYQINRGVKSKKVRLKKMITDLVERTLYEDVKYDEKLKLLIDNSRIKVQDTLPVVKSERKKNDLNVGQECYICMNTSRPFIVDSAYVFDVNSMLSEKRYSIIHFTNLDSSFGITNKLEVNGIGFINVYGDELGLTPADAVRNKY